MAGFIYFSDDELWSAPNWAYWGLMDHLIASFSNDSLAAHTVEVCKWAQCLSFPLLFEDDGSQAKKIQDQLQVVAMKAASGEFICKANGQDVDELSQLQFREMVKLLVNLIKTAV